MHVFMFAILFLLSTFQACLLHTTVVVLSQGTMVVTETVCSLQGLDAETVELILNESKDKVNGLTSKMEKQKMTIEQVTPTSGL